MKHIDLRTMILLGAVTIASVGCRELTGIVEDFFTMSVLPPPGGERYGGIQGGQIAATLRLQNGSNVRTSITFSFDVPANVTARVDVQSTIDADVVLQPDEVRDVPLLINIGANQPAGLFSIDVIGNGLSVRTDISGGDEYTDTEMVTVEVDIGADDEPPTVTIRDPEPNTSFSVIPFSGAALATDDGAVVELTYRLNDAASVRVWSPQSNDDPTTSIDQTFEVPDLANSPSGHARVGTNVLTVTARDARGQTASTSVEFTYEPTGQCPYFQVVPSRTSITAAPGDQIALRATITPLGGWMGGLVVAPGLRGIFTSGSNASMNNVSGPIDVHVLGNLRDDLTPGQSYHMFVRVQGLTPPVSVCEAAVPVEIVEPGIGARPQVTIDSPASDQVTANASVTLNATVTDDGFITDVYYRNEFDAATGFIDVRTSDTPSPFSFSESVTLVPGLNVIRVFAVDNEGRQSSTAIGVTYEVGGGGQCTEFTMETSPGELIASPGATDYAGILISRSEGFTGAVSLSIQEPFADSFFSSATFEPNPTMGNSTMAVTVSDGPSSVEWIGGTFLFTVVGTSGSSQCATVFTVEVPDA